MIKKEEEAPKKVEAPKPVVVQKKSEETPMAYSDEIVRKVKQMKDVFNDADVPMLLDYVKNSTDLAIEELIEGYLAIQESIDFAPKKVAEETPKGDVVVVEKKVEKKRVEETPRGDSNETPNGDEAPKGFSEAVVKKVKQMKEIFPEADVVVLLDFVNCSGDVSFDDLIDNYLEMCQENIEYLKANCKEEEVEEPKEEKLDFPERVIEHAKNMKEILSETDIKDLCEFVNNAPESWTLNDLIESYLQ